MDPRPEPITPASIERAVRARILGSPYVLYPGVAALLSGMGALLFTSPLTVGLALAGPVLLLAGWQYEKRVHSPAYLLSYLAEANRRLGAERSAKSEDLLAKLEEVGATQGMEQLRMFQGKFQNYREILGQKFRPEELTYGRYLGIAEQVYLAGLDNLERVYLALKSVSTVDAAALTARLAPLAREGDEGARAEADTLRERLALYNEQIALTEHLLLQNELAMTELDNVTAKVATVVTHKGEADLDLDQAMEELRRLAEGARRYGQG